ncbi:MAG: hypothetical protein HWD58_12015 [Bacteroidota bacterium]|nr:MAG: hypothetical protein HWD58_12015 [Bacteroidota bacterium]
MWRLGEFDTVVVTINAFPTANAGADKNLNCTTTSTTIGTASVAGHTYSWSPSNGLSSTLIAQPTASPTATTSYTVTVTNSSTGCTATDVVVVNVNTTPPSANAGRIKFELYNNLSNHRYCGPCRKYLQLVSCQWIERNQYCSTHCDPGTTTNYVVTVTG